MDYDSLHHDSTMIIVKLQLDLFNDSVIKLSYRTLLVLKAA